jgi:hypothetical protein
VAIVATGYCPERLERDRETIFMFSSQGRLRYIVFISAGEIKGTTPSERTSRPITVFLQDSLAKTFFKTRLSSRLDSPSATMASSSDAIGIGMKEGEQRTNYR